MNINEFNRLLAQKRRELDNLIRRKMPEKVGKMAKAHYQDNIRVRQGFQNGGITPYPATRRKQSGSNSAAANYGALLSSKKHLYNSIKYTPSDYRVRVANDLKYAPVHNWGGTVQVTPRMRRYFWYRYISTPGKKKGKKTVESDEQKKWKALALSAKKKSAFVIPQRQFLGKSRELEDQIWQTLDNEVRSVIHKS
ncbi:MAG: phage virion morphogenesis protein [Dysgonamonadaceae bacterium]|jgi:phage gpG-like protein|nr:phage virion morphogenesis protein [Dysgonamonadaceae bacterium]